MREFGRTLCLSLLCASLAACSTAQPTPAPGDTPLAPTAQPSSAVSSPAASLTDGQTALPTDSPSISATPNPTSTAPESPTASAPPATSPPTGSFDPQAIALATEPFASGFDALTFVTNAGDGSGRLFAVERRGVIRLLDSLGVVATAPFLDIADRVQAGGERGLLGLAFHPDFESNGRFFVNYTAAPGGNTVVAEFGLAADGNGDPASERVLLTINQPFSNHNGGMIAFGPDGYLYIATGDGGSGGDPRNNGQSLNTLLGKILRIDVNSGDPYGIPPDNPFAGGAGRPEIWSYGLRNPWRFSFDSATGAMFIGDVGQSAVEEIDAEPAGAGGRNYGWNLMEGDQCYPSAPCDRSGLTMPVATYGRDGNCSVTGGYVYRGSQLAQLFGGYVFSDYCSGRLWALDAQSALDNGQARVFSMAATSLRPSSFGQDEAGELYVVHLPGEIHRLVAVPR